MVFVWFWKSRPGVGGFFIFVNCVISVTFTFARVMIKSLSALVSGAFGGLPREVWLVSAAQLINRAGMVVIFFVAIYLHKHIGLPLGQVGIVMAMSGAGSFAGVLLGGRLSDRIGYYPVLVGSLILGGLVFISISFMREFSTLCIGFFLAGVIGDAYRPANMAAIAHIVPQEKYTRAVTLNRLAINLGFSIGPVIGGVLSDVNSSWIFWLNGLSCMAAGLLVYFTMEHHKPERAQGEEKKLFPASSPFRDKHFIFFLPFSMLYAMVFLQFFTTMQLYYEEIQHLSGKQIGLIMGLNGLIVATSEMLLVYKLEKRWTLFNFITTGALLLVVAYLMLLAANGLSWMIVLVVIVSVSEMAAMPFMNTFMNSRAAKHNRGRYASLYVLSWSVAQSITPIVVTQTILHSGYDLLWILFAAGALLVAGGIKILEHRISRDAA